ncbi:MAG: hypothetical protein IJ226_03825 [Clostridia bacterium]|nr:hypothetical protein [Clostridia bacterium]
MAPKTEVKEEIKEEVRSEKNLGERFDLDLDDDEMEFNTDMLDQGVQRTVNKEKDLLSK